MKIGDILVAKFGYNCTLVDFYKVINRTPKMVTVQKIGSKIVSHDGYGQAGYVVADEEVVEDEVLKRKIIESTEAIKISDYCYAYKWDGNEVRFDSYD